MNNVETEIKNDLLLKVLDGHEVARPPVWMMRQAGRFLPDYRKLRDRYPFFERIQNPELAAEITVMPVDQLDVDAAILFSDILIVPQALDLEVQMVANTGPVIRNPVRTPEDAFRLAPVDILDRLSYTFDAISASRERLQGAVPLLGFSGSPWTLFCYMVEGQGSKDFAKAKSFCYQHPSAAHHILTLLTNSIITFLEGKVSAGVDAIQIFDSWGGLLSPAQYDEFSFPYIERIVDALARKTRVLVFPKGCWFTLNKWTHTSVDAVSLDWTITPEFAREQTENKLVLQGNLDPSVLTGPQEVIRKSTLDMVSRFGLQKYIANLGHGILPGVPVDNARVFIDTIKGLS